jgi:hypothetical protein
MGRRDEAGSDRIADGDDDDYYDGDDGDVEVYFVDDRYPTSSSSSSSSSSYTPTTTSTIPSSISPTGSPTSTSSPTSSPTASIAPTALPYDPTYYEPIRIILDGSQLYQLVEYDPGRYAYLVEYVMEIAGWNAARFWSDHLSTIPVEEEIQISGDDCPLAFGTASEGGEEDGGSNAADDDAVNRTYTNADLVIYLLMDDGPCLGENPPIAFTSDCLSDQYDRPIAGTVLLCTTGNFDGISSIDDEGVDDVVDNVNLAQRRKIDEVLQHEYAHLLGMSGNTAPFWRDSTNGGRPYSARPLIESEVMCPNGLTDTVYLPSTSTYAMGTTSRGMMYYEVATPTVRNVIMNQFDCHDDGVVRGARLDMNDNNCLGSHWSTVSWALQIMRSMSELSHISFACV